MPVMDRVVKTQDQILESMETLQSQVIDANKKIVEANQMLTDRVSERLAGRVPTIPVPTAAEEMSEKVSDRLSVAMPTPKEAVDNYFRFVEKATKSNKKFAKEMVKVWSKAGNAPAKSAKAAKKAEAAEAAE